MFNKKVLAASMAVAMAGGMATTTNAMQVDPNYVGQVLLGPVYFADSGYTTDIAVVNVRTDAAVKAKVVFRSHGDSNEVKDFIIYLSPNDVWRGTVMSESGTTYITSTDDSMLSAIDFVNDFGVESNRTYTYGSTTAVKEAFSTANLASDDSASFGHFEVIGVASASGTYSVASVSGSTKTSVTVTQGMSKNDLLAVFNGDVTNSASDPLDNSANDIFRETDEAICTASQVATGGVANAISSISPCALQITGTVDIKDANGRVSMQTAALANSSIGETDDYVIGNDSYNASIGAESNIGTAMGVGATDNIQVIETALANSFSGWTYETSGMSTDTIVTFPTKYRHFGDTVDSICGGSGNGASAADQYSAPFQDTTIGEMQYAFSSVDNSENGRVVTPSGTQTVFSPLPAVVAAPIVSFNDEVNYSNRAFGTGNSDYYAESGWANYQWSPRSGCVYAGAPAQVYSYKYSSAGTARTILKAFVQ